MFARKINIDIVSADGEYRPAPLKWIDSFAMRNFTNDAAFDDTLPLSDGLMEAGHRVSMVALQVAMEDWFRRKSWLKSGETLSVRNGSAD